MRNSALYARKVKRLLSEAARGRTSAPADEPPDLLRLLVRAVMSEDATAKQLEAAMPALEEEYVDLNELRVSPIKDLVECLGQGFPRARAKAMAITTALNAVYDQVNGLNLEFLAKKPKREVRKTLREKLGLSPYAESVVTLYGFEGHAVPADDLLADALKLEKMIHPDSDVADLQGFLERIIAHKDAKAAHEALRACGAKHAGRVMREWARQEKRAAEAEAKARAAAEAKAEAEAKAKAEAEAAAQAKAKAAKKDKRKAAAKKRPPAKRTRKAVPPRSAGGGEARKKTATRARTGGARRTSKKK